MPRIPVIEQTTSVSTTTPSPQAQGSQVISPIANAASVAADGLAQIGHGMMLDEYHQQERDGQKEIQNLPTSDAQVYWKQYLTDAPKNFQDGGNVPDADGKLVGFRGKAQQDFDAYSQQFMAGVKTPKAQEYARGFLERLRTQTLDNAITMEARANVDNAGIKIQGDVNNWSSLAAAETDPAKVQGYINEMKIKVANAGFDQATRNSVAMNAQNAIVEAAVHGAIERDPTATRAALIHRYGIDPTVPPKPTQPDAVVIGGVPSGVAPGVQKYADTIVQQAQAKGVDPVIMSWQLDKESKGNTNAVNTTDGGSTGIAQFQAGTAKRYGIDPKDPVQSIQGQAAYMSDLLKMFGGDYQKALAGYNWGEGNVQKAVSKYGDAWLDHAPATTKDYVSTIMKNAGSSAGAGRGNVNPTSVAPDTGIPVTPPAPAFSPELSNLVNQLPVEKLPSYISAATTQVNQQQAAVRSQVAATEQDHVTAFMNGQTVAKPLTEADYTRAYGAEGAARFENYQAVQQLGQDINAMKAMPPAQIDAMVQHYQQAADPNKPGYELATKRLGILMQAREQVNQARQADPMDYAMRNGVGGAAPLNFNDPKAFGAELAKRQGVAATMRATYDAPFSMLSKAEASTLYKGFETMTTQQRLGYLNTIKSSVSDPAAYRSIMQQIAPDSPVTAMAGIILSKQQPMVNRGWFSDTMYSQQDVAGLMLEGEALINPNKADKADNGKGKTFPLPKEQDMRDQFTNAVGKAFAGDPNGANFAFQAVKAYYVGKAARDGDVSGTIDSGRMKDAINAVIGGVTDVNGKGEVVRPWGMDDSHFKDAAKVAFDKAIDANGYKGSPLDVYGAYGLQAAGDSKYLLRTGTGYLTGRNGQPVVLDLTQPFNATANIPTGGPTDNGRGWAGAVTPAPIQKPNLQRPATK